MQSPFFVEADMNNLLKWKSKYGKIGTVTYDGKEVIYRPMTMNELDTFYSLVGKVEQSLLDEMLADMCVLNMKKPADMLKPGNISSLADAIQKASLPPEDELKNELEKERNEAHSRVTPQLVGEIMAILPGANPVELANLPFYRLNEVRATAYLIMDMARPQNVPEPNSEPAPGRRGNVNTDPIVQSAQNKAMADLNAALKKPVPTLEQAKKQRSQSDIIRAKNSKLEEKI